MQAISDRVKRDYHKRKRDARAAARAAARVADTPPASTPRRPLTHQPEVDDGNDPSDTEASISGGGGDSSSDDEFADPIAEIEMPPKGPKPGPSGGAAGGGTNAGNDSGDDIVVDFDQENKPDLEGAQSRIPDVAKVAFDPEDLVGWLDRLEIRAEAYGINSQWSKRMALELALAANLANTLKSLFKKRKAVAGNLIYYECKQLQWRTMV